MLWENGNSDKYNPTCNIPKITATFHINIKQRLQLNGNPNFARKNIFPNPPLLLKKLLNEIIDLVKDTHKYILSFYLFQ